MTRKKGLRVVATCVSPNFFDLIETFCEKHNYTKAELLRAFLRNLLNPESNHKVSKATERIRKNV